MHADGETAPVKDCPSQQQVGSPRMIADQLIRLILERAIADGLVHPATGRFADPDPQKRTCDEVKDLAEMVIRWQKC